MKLHLPKLLFAMLVCPAVYAGPFVVAGPTYNSGTGEQEMYPFMLHPYNLYEGSTNAAPIAMVKDSVGTDWVFNQKIYDKSYSFGAPDFAFYNPFVVREGKVRIENVDLVSKFGSEKNSPNSYVPYFSVGGTQAELCMTNASLVNNEGSSYAIALGTADGAATVNMDNSRLSTRHFIFIGDVGGMGTENDYVKYTLNKDGSRYQGDGSTETVVNIKNGSRLEAGTSLQISNATINVDGVGSSLTDNQLGKSPSAPAAQDPCSYFAYDGADGVRTVINVTKGASLDCNWNVSTGYSKDSATVITVDGTGVDENSQTVKSTFSVAGTADFGGAEGWWTKNNAPEGENSSTSVVIRNGAEAQFNQVRLGVNREAQLTVADNMSSIVAHEGASDAVITVYEKGTLNNSGSIGINIELAGGVFTMEDKAIAAGLTATSGTVALSGEVTFTGAVQLGSAATFAAADGAAAPLTLVFMQGTVVNADNFVIMPDTVIQVALTGDYQEGEVLFTINGEHTDVFTGKEVYFIDEQGEVYGMAEMSYGANGQVTSAGSFSSIPEPATATLSLLALMGLAARRRRK